MRILIALALAFSISSFAGHKESTIDGYEDICTFWVDIRTAIAADRIEGMHAEKAFERMAIHIAELSPPRITSAVVHFEEVWEEQRSVPGEAKFTMRECLKAYGHVEI